MNNQRKKELEKATVTPQAFAKSEIERRKEVQETLELKKKNEEMKREAELRQAQKERIQDLQARDKVKAKIAAQKAARAGNSAAPEAAKPTPTAQSSGPKAAPTQCVLKLAFTSTGANTVLTLKPSDTLTTVERELKSQSLIPAGTQITFENVFPRTVINRNQWNTTLLDLDLCPRAQLNVKF